MALYPMPITPRNWNSAAAGVQGGQLTAFGAVILVVDAAHCRRRSISATLRGLGHTFVEAHNAVEALEVIRVRKIDLVIADLLAVEAGAGQFLKTIRDSPETALLPIILVGRRGHIEEEVAAMEAGADAVLAPHIHPRAFRASVQSWLRRKAAVEALDETESVLYTLAQSVEERDPALGAHCGRLSLIAAAMGIKLGLTTAEIRALQHGGYLHDVGKVAIPDAVLFKPGPLTADEWVIMKSHTERGERICKNVRSLEAVLPIIRSHHERLDGGGYPDKLKGEEIPLLARIIQLADIYDALTTERPYKRAFPAEEAVEIMRKETAKGWRDPNLMKTFLELEPLFRGNASLELSALSLQALARSLEGNRTGETSARMPEPIRMARGL